MLDEDELPLLERLKRRRGDLREDISRSSSASKNITKQDNSKATTRLVCEDSVEEKNGESLPLAGFLVEFDKQLEVLHTPSAAACAASDARSCASLQMGLEAHVHPYFFPVNK